MLDFLNKPYPFSFQPKRRLKQIIPVSIGVFLFAIIFKPFGLESNPHYIKESAIGTFICAVIALITTVLIPYFAKGCFNESKWTLKNNLVWVCIMIIIFISLMYFSYAIYYKQTITWNSYFKSCVSALKFGIPIGLIVNLVNQYYLQKKHLKEVISINRKLKTFANIHEDETNQLHDAALKLIEYNIDRINKVQFAVHNLVYVEALGNYVTIAYQQDGNKKITVRDTISNIEQKVETSELFYKPHRSYLVNMKNIENVTGDSQGLKIHLKGFDQIIPVSRNKIKEFKELVASAL